MSIIADQTLLANPDAIVIPVLPLAVELGPGPATLVAVTCTLCWCVCVCVHAHLHKFVFYSLFGSGIVALQSICSEIK